MFLLFLFFFFFLLLLLLIFLYFQLIFHLLLPTPSTQKLTSLPSLKPAALPPSSTPPNLLSLKFLVSLFALFRLFFLFTLLLFLHRLIDFTCYRSLFPPMYTSSPLLSLTNLCLYVHFLSALLTHADTLLFFCLLSTSPYLSPISCSHLLPYAAPLNALLPFVEKQGI